MICFLLGGWSVSDFYFRIVEDFLKYLVPFTIYLYWRIQWELLGPCGTCALWFSWSMWQLYWRVPNINMFKLGKFSSEWSFLSGGFKSALRVLEARTLTVIWHSLLHFFPSSLLGLPPSVLPAPLTPFPIRVSLLPFPGNKLSVWGWNRRRSLESRRFHYLTAS